MCGGRQKDYASPASTGSATDASTSSAIGEICWPGDKGRGFLAAGDCLAELPVINLQAKPDRFFYFTLHDLLLLDPVDVQTLQYLIYFV